MSLKKPSCVSLKENKLRKVVSEVVGTKKLLYHFSITNRIPSWLRHRDGYSYHWLCHEKTLKRMADRIFCMRLGLLKEL